MSYHYQQHNRYFAQAAGFLEEAAADELKSLGAERTDIGYRGVHFEADQATMHRINYGSRLITRVLAPLIEFDCHSDRYLYKTAGQIDWSDFLDLDTTFAIFASASNSWIDHSQFAARRLKDAIVDQFRDRTGERPSVRTPDPDVWFNLHIHANRAIISVDMSGGSLHRRGYRTESVEAPMQETVAAAVIRYSEWNGETPLYDPMCGSGTLLAEAYMHASGLPPGFRRRSFGFEHLPDHDADSWRRTRTQMDGAIKPVPADLIRGSDVDSASVDAARENLANLPGADSVTVSRADFRSLPGFQGTTIVCNPPYGLRIGGKVEGLYKEFGDWMKQRCTGSKVFLYAGKPQLLKSVGLRTTFKKELVNGALEGRLARYDLY